MYPLLYAPRTSSLDGYVRNINVAIIIIILGAIEREGEQKGHPQCIDSADVCMYVYT